MRYLIISAYLLTWSGFIAWVVESEMQSYTTHMTGWEPCHCN